MIKNLVAAATLLAGCDCGWTDLPARPIRAVSFVLGPPGAEEWSALVERAGEAWNTALVNVGCQPLFHMAADDDELAYPIRLWNVGDWPWFDIGAVGFTVEGSVDEGYIDILVQPNPADHFSMVLHEMGHTLRLDHVDDKAAAMWIMPDSRHLAPNATDERLLKESSRCLEATP